MRNLILLFMFAFNPLKGQITLTKFDFEGRDSTLKCKILYDYKRLTTYINKYFDPSVPKEDKYYFELQLYYLLSDDPDSKSRFGIFDQSLEDKIKPYNRSEYINLLNELKTFNYTYQKDFIKSGSPDIEYDVNSELNPVETDADFSYRSPFSSFSLEFIENSIKSASSTSNVRNQDRIKFLKYLFIKKLEGRYSKMVREEQYEEFGRPFKALYEKKEKRCKIGTYDVRDSIRKNECKILEDSLLLIENELVSKELKFLHINEVSKIEDIDDELKRLEKSFLTCHCPEPEPIQDSDGDGFNYLVDCNDNDSSIHPGAIINCNNSSTDDNCDGSTDFCCEDKDGDGFYNAKDCDCKTDLDSDDIMAKCDCNDNDKSVFPLASIDCNNGITDDNCDGQIDTLQYQVSKEVYLNFFDNIYPPYGLTNFGRDGSFYCYSAILTIGLASTLYHRIKSNNYIELQNKSTTIRQSKRYYQLANKHHQWYRVSAGITIGFYIASQIDMRIEYRKYNKVRNEVRDRNKNCTYLYKIDFNPLAISSDGIGPSLTLNF